MRAERAWPARLACAAAASCATALAGGDALAGGADDPLLAFGRLDRLERRSDALSALDGSAWIGYDLSKVWLELELERAAGDTETAEARLLHGRAIAPFWDLRVGLRADLEPRPRRHWLALGVQGLAPYHFKLDATAFFGPSGRAAVRLHAEYELLLTQRWILSPELELDLHARDDPEVGVGVGLSRVEAGVRLRYEIRREFAPYLGVHWERSRAGRPGDGGPAGAERVEASFALGLRAWR